MVKVEELLKPTALEVLIGGVREHTLWRKFYVLLDKSLLKVKQVMKNYIRVKETDLL